jgi:stress-induced-phosphoprotein 1
MAEAEKAKGNAAMGQQNYAEAVKHYSAAIELDGANYLLYSNRSAAYASMGSFEEALADGEKTIELKSDFGKVRHALQLLPGFFLPWLGLLT